MRSRSLAKLVVLIAAEVALAARSAHAQTVVVPTFPVGTATFSEHLQDVDVAAGTDGSFVVIWGAYSLHSLSGAADHAVTRRFSADGIPLGSPVKVDTSAHVFDPRISPDGHGSYVAAWQWIRNGQQYLFFGQLLDGLGAPATTDFEVTLNLPGNGVLSGTVLGRPFGPVFLWSQDGFWARALDTNGDRQGGDIRSGSGGYRNDVAAMADGGFVTVWTGGFDEPGSMGRIFGPGGQPRTDAFLVSTVFGSEHVAASPLGGVAMTGTRWNADFSAVDVWARRFTDDGVPLGDEFLVNAGEPGLYAEPDLEFDALGNLYVVWTEYFTDGRPFLPPRARAFDTKGNPLGPAVRISDKQGAEIRTTRLQNGNFVNIWYYGGQAWGNIVALCTPEMAVCGDGVYQAACEQCDTGAANSDSAPDACRSDCRKPLCGDGVTDSGEQCDDGNTENCDGCDAGCRIEAGFACGDGVRSRACGEQCDAGAANSDALPNACRTDCLEAHCGDGVVDSGEECDDGNRLSCDGCSFDCRREANLPDSDGNGVADVCDACQLFAGPEPLCGPQPFQGLTNAQATRFAGGRAEFLQVENPATGLGPVFNAAACAECHNQPTAGGSSARFVTRIGTMAADGYTFDPLTAHGGSLLQTRGISTATCSVDGEVVPPEATIIARRNTPPLYGLGLLEAIPELRIRLFADVIDHNHDGISGGYNTSNGLIGRFGWKAQVALLQDFAGQAYLDEMGITSPYFPAENNPQGGPLVCDDEPDPETDGTAVAEFTDFLMLLAPPPTPTTRPRAVLRGRQVFRKLQCHKCHTDKYRTARNFPVQLLRNRRVLAYTDLLVHDMGPGLADGIVQGYARGPDFRTAPLWGVKYSAPYLHDGRAATLLDAVAAHGGEAQGSVDRFVALSAQDRAALVAFLNSL